MQTDRKGPELFFALVSPIGNYVDRFAEALATSLCAYSYKTHYIKLSDELVSLAEARSIALPEAFGSRKEALMDEGDRVCARSGVDSAVAILGVAALRTRRSRENRNAGVPKKIALRKPIERTAYILDSLKRPAEVAQLRQIYGDHLIVFALQSSPRSRVEQLIETLRPQSAHSSPKALAKMAEDLIERDLIEFRDDKHATHGQNVLKTFPMADVFVNMDANVEGQIVRVLRLLFDDTESPAPEDDEVAMSLAQIASSRSQELGRHVGAVLLRKDGSVAGMGANVHPTRRGLAPFDSSEVDIRDLVQDAVARLGESYLKKKVRRRMSQAPDDFVRELLDGVLASAKIKDLTEFMPPVHAEMNAVLDAVKHGSSVEGATVFATTYPCHNCAKHLIALNLPVRYIEPYPKGRAERMYGKDVEDFLPFTGIAPRQFSRLFFARAERKNPDGSRQRWRSVDRKSALPKVTEMEGAGIGAREALAVGQLKLQEL